MRHTYLVNVPAIEVTREYMSHRDAIKYARSQQHTARVSLLTHRHGNITEGPVTSCGCDACHEGLCAVQDPCKRADCKQYWCRETFT